jgi:hypothetical protein
MKTAKEERRLQEADAEIGREFGQMTGILMDTLVGVSADLFEGGQIYGYRVERAALERELRFDPRKGVARPVRPCNCAPCELQPGGCDKARR